MSDGHSTPPRRESYKLFKALFINGKRFRLRIEQGGRAADADQEVRQGTLVAEERRGACRSPDTLHYPDGPGNDQSDATCYTWVGLGQ